MVNLLSLLHISLLSFFKTSYKYQFVTWVNNQTDVYLTPIWYKVQT